MPDDDKLPTATQRPAPASDAEIAAMRRALELAALGPATGDHARVGAVILGQDGTQLSEGFHRGAGTPHAEVDAMAKLAPDQVRGSTVVVTLEPCDHVGRTGPCSVALIAAGVRRVVYAIDDPGAVSHGGADRLRDAGVEVVSGVLADESSAFLERWLLSMRLGRPWVTLKWASSLDGRVAAVDGSSRWITGPEARRDAHERRAQHDAIVVGTGTLLADDPALTARASNGALLDAQPLPVVLGHAAVPESAAVRRHPRGFLSLRGHDLTASLRALREHGVHTALVEGGPTIASALVGAGLVDEILVYLAPTLLGGPRVAISNIGVGSIGEQRRLTVLSMTTLGTDFLLTARPDRSST